MSVRDLTRRLEKIEGRTGGQLPSRDELETALNMHIEALRAEHGDDWEAIYRQELQERDPTLLALWDRVQEQAKARQERDNALFQHISGGLKSLRDRFGRLAAKER